jgi:membrane protein implicated in regulation of membrane protease activity
MNAALGVRFLAGAFLAGAFFATTFLAGAAFFAAGFLAGAAFLAGAFFAVAIFDFLLEVIFVTRSKTNLPSGLDATGENCRFQGEKHIFHSRTQVFSREEFAVIGVLFVIGLSAIS